MIRFSSLFTEEPQAIQNYRESAKNIENLQTITYKE
jgi:hypothetical protein